MPPINDLVDGICVLLLGVVMAVCYVGGRRQKGTDMTESVSIEYLRHIVNSTSQYDSTCRELAGALLVAQDAIAHVRGERDELRAQRTDLAEAIADIAKNLAVEPQALVEDRSLSLRENDDTNEGRTAEIARLRSRVDNLERLFAGEVPKMSGRTIQLDDLAKFCRNIGYNLECGACAEIFFTGCTTGEHTCTPGLGWHLLIARHIMLQRIENLMGELELWHEAEDLHDAIAHHFERLQKERTEAVDAAESLREQRDKARTNLRHATEACETNREAADAANRALIAAEDMLDAVETSQECPATPWLDTMEKCCGVCANPPGKHDPQQCPLDGYVRTTKRV